jgi:chromosome segregation ATPase
MDTQEQIGDLEVRIISVHGRISRLESNIIDAQKSTDANLARLETRIIGLEADNERLERIFNDYLGRLEERFEKLQDSARAGATARERLGIRVTELRDRMNVAILRMEARIRELEDRHDKDIREFLGPKVEVPPAQPAPQLDGAEIARLKDLDYRFQRSMEAIDKRFKNVTSRTGRIQMDVAMLRSGTAYPTATNLPLNAETAAGFGLHLEYGMKFDGIERIAWTTAQPPEWIKTSSGGKLVKRWVGEPEDVE